MENDINNIVTDNVYKPDLSIKKPSELVKVEILEETVQKGALQDVVDVLNTYKTFEMTARALGIASRYRGIEFVEEMVKHGATFEYKKDNNTIKGRYKTYQSTATGTYSTEYCLMLVPEKIDYSMEQYGRSIYAYSPMCGFHYINISPELSPLSIEKRIEIAKYLYEHKESGRSMDEMLFWALTNCELDFADALIEMGVTLQETPPSYYGKNEQTYISIVTSLSKSVYRNTFIEKMGQLDSSEVLPVIERFHNLAVKAGAKLIITEKMFQSIKWDTDSMTFIVNNADISRIKPKDLIKKAVAYNSVGALEVISENGWLSNRKNREEMTEFARNNNYNDSLAWLMDFKKRTVDIAKEEAEDKAKILKELMEDPNSVSAIKRRFKYKKLDDGTLRITDYIGDEYDIIIPPVIGRTIVTSIGEGAFSPWWDKSDNKRKIMKVTIPNGVEEIDKYAFRDCELLEEVIIPESVKKIGSRAFSKCSKLKNILFSKRVKVGACVFDGCTSLCDSKGLIIIDDVLYYIEPDQDVALCEIPNGIKKIASYVFSTGKDWSIIKEIRFPEGLKEIGDGVFEKMTGITKISLPGSVNKVGERAFYGCTNLESVDLPNEMVFLGTEAFANCGLTVVRIPNKCKTLSEKAFYGCKQLQDIYIPSSVQKIGNNLIGDFRVKPWDAYSYEPKDIRIHTPKGSVAEEYMKQYGEVNVLNDFE